MATKITQAALSGLVLEWTANDPVDLEFIQRDAAALDGDYVCQIRRGGQDDVLAAATITTTVVAGDWDTTDEDGFVDDVDGDHLRVRFVLSVANSKLVGAGGRVFDIQESGDGLTRWSGDINAARDVTRV